MIEKKEIKILLTSDLHLGISDEVSIVPEKYRIQTLKKISTIAMEHDVLLIAGDFIDNTEIKDETFDLIKNECKKLRSNNIDILYTPGSGEIDSRGIILKSLSKIKASTIFTNPVYEKPYVVEKNEQKIFFYGMPPLSGYDISKIAKEDSKGIHIGLFYVNFDNTENAEKLNLFSLKKTDFKNLNLDFYALGHNHNFRMFKVQDRIIGAYPGSPEAVTFDETGDRYVISIIIQDNEILNIKRLLINSVTVETTEIDCSHYGNDSYIQNLIINEKSDKKIKKITLCGKRDFSIDFDLIKKNERDYLKLIIDDQTIPSIESIIKRYKDEDTLRGDFFQTLHEYMQEGKLPDNINQDNLAKLLNAIVKNGYENVEEWLCDLSNA